MRFPYKRWTWKRTTHYFSSASGLKIAPHYRVQKVPGPKRPIRFYGRKKCPQIEASEHLCSHQKKKRKKKNLWQAQFFFVYDSYASTVFWILIFGFGTNYNVTVCGFEDLRRLGEKNTCCYINDERSNKNKMMWTTRGVCNNFITTRRNNANSEVLHKYYSMHYHWSDIFQWDSS